MRFIPGIELCRRFHDELVRPILADRLPGLPYAAARLDCGSELLGFDTARSTDHDWGPRLQLFVRPADRHLAGQIDAALADLPRTFLGFPTRFAGHPDSSLGVLSADGDRHGVVITTLDVWFTTDLGFDPRRGVTATDWLGIPTQRLAEVTGGAIFHDGLGGELTAARARLAWYPDDVWRHVLAGLWTRIGQEEHLVGRCAEVGDELGSVVVAARLVRDLMRLSLLLARRYPPYSKWLGSAFARLPDIAPLAEELAGALAPTTWRAREARLCRAYETVAARSNEVGLAPALDPTVRQFHNRPFRVLDAGRFAANLRSQIADPALRDLPPVGAVDQFVDNTDVLTHVARARSTARAVLPAQG